MARSASCIGPSSLRSNQRVSSSSPTPWCIRTGRSVAAWSRTCTRTWNATASAEEADAYLAQWAEEDFYVSLPDELALIADAEFPRPDCFWRDGMIAVYGAFKDA
jgi:hypothetical protein